MSWYLGVLKQYAVFRGRARRQEFWMFFVFNTIISIVLDVISQVTLGSDLLAYAYYLAVFLPSAGLAIRRLHDTGRSGWSLLVLLIPLVGGIVLLVLCAKEGNAGANQYGPEPRQAIPA